MTRKLTITEIDDILDFIKPQEHIPPDTALSIVTNTKNRLIRQLEKQLVHPEIIPVLKQEIKRQYITSIIQPGESVGISCAQSIGEKQTQCSVAYDEKIVLKKNDGAIINTTIGEYIDDEMMDCKIIKTNQNGYIKSVDNVEILTITQNEKIEWKKISELSCHPPNGGMVKVTTQSGRSVTTTLSHSHLCKKDGAVEPILGSDLKIGDRVPVFKRTPIPLHDMKRD